MHNYIRYVATLVGILLIALTALAAACRVAW